MATIVSHSDLLQRAVAFVVEGKSQCPEKRIDMLVEEAAVRFNLSPLEAESLLRLLHDENINAHSPA